MRELYQITWTNSLKFYRQQQQSPLSDSIRFIILLFLIRHFTIFHSQRQRTSKIIAVDWKTFYDHRNCSFILINLFLILHYLRRHLPITSPPLFHFSNVSFWHFFQHVSWKQQNNFWTKLEKKVHKIHKTRNENKIIYKILFSNVFPVYISSHILHYFWGQQSWVSLIMAERTLISFEWS